MSMTVVTILQLITVSVIYCGMTVFLPALVFHKKMEGERLCVRFLAYLLMGNFYLMNLVFVLQLLHISNRFTLILFTVVPAFWAAVKINRLDVKEYVLDVVKQARRFFEGTMGVRLFVSNVYRGVLRGLRRPARKLTHDFREDFFDWAGTALVVLLVLWMFGTNLLKTFGYCASDIPVHNYWINELSNNNIFAAGVYPYGFHCVLYYIHEVFGLETFVLLRLFCLVQTMLVHLVLLAFLKIVCRTKYMPYLAFVLYTLGNFWNPDVIKRYYSSLPQEFGMIFILPAAAFLLMFFPARKKEQGEKGIRLHSTRYLVWFGMSFSMTLAVHFYNTMIIGLFCLGIAAGYLGLLFRPAYFGRIMLAGIISILVAVLPMGIAYATGTPLQGSLGWGMNIIKGSSGQEGQTSDDPGVQEPEDTPATEISGSEGNAPQGGGESVVVQPKPQKPPLKERVQNLFQGLQNSVYVNILNQIDPKEVTLWLLTVPTLALFGVLNLFSKSGRAYGCMLISVAAFLLLLCVLLISSRLGIPALMEPVRCSIYLSYMLAAAVALCGDAAVSLVLGRLSNAWIMHFASLAVTAAFTVCVIAGGKGRTPLVINGLETNGAIACLTNILKDEKNWMFTVCSANDEFRMVEDYGYHYETITFLREMEGIRQRNYLTIPTPRTYFFIEKIPGDYTLSYAGSGRTVSEEGAAYALPGGAGLDMYKGESRYIVMSRMYYWAQAFRELYPTEMKVYYETDNFICYVLEQNPYRLFDLAIDYGYNMQ